MNYNLFKQALRLIWSRAWCYQVLLLTSLLTVPSYAATTEQVLATIATKLKINLPDLVVDQVSATPMPGIYEVDSGRKVFYVDGSGNYALIGNLMDLKTKTNLTEQRSSALNRINWQQLPTDSAIMHVIGTGKNKLAVFTDPDCPFCKRLEAETIAKLSNVTVYYYLFPLAIHPHAADHAKRILCAENPESSLIAFMTKDKPLGQNNSCDNSLKLAKMQALGTNLLQVSGTPTLVLANGKIVSGLVPADYLTRLIEENPAESALTRK